MSADANSGRRLKKRQIDKQIELDRTKKIKIQES
jgi:hypothetical protein